jgi:hypothetical protein
MIRYLLAILICLVFQYTLLCQEYGLLKFSSESSSNFGANIEYNQEANEFYCVYSRTCDRASCSQVVCIEEGFEVRYERTLPLIDIAIQTAVYHTDSLLVCGNDDFQSKWLIQVLAATSGDTLGLIELPILYDMHTMFVHDMKYFDDKYYVSGRGKTSDEGMIPLVYVLNNKFELDTLLLVDTVRNGRVGVVDQMNDGTILTFYDNQGFDDQRLQRYVVKGFDVKDNYQKNYNYITPERTDDALVGGSGTYLSPSNRIVLHSTYSDLIKGSQFNVLDSLGNLERSWNTFIQGNFSAAFHQSRNIVALADGNFLSLGQWWDSRDEAAVYRHSPYIAKYDPDTGRKIWDRVFYQKDYFRDDALATGAILDAVELENGDIALTGYIQEDTSRMLFAVLDSNGCLEPDCGFKIDISDITVGLEEKENYEVSDIRIYPNPIIGDELYLNTTFNQLTISIVDMYGQEWIKYYNYNDKVLDISSLTSGAYVIHIRSEDGMLINTQKFIRL